MSTSEQPDAPGGGFPDSDSVASKPIPEQPSANDDEIIDGGTITLSPQPVSWKERHETETAKVLTFVLFSGQSLNSE